MNNNTQIKTEIKFIHLSDSCEYIVRDDERKEIFLSLILYLGFAIYPKDSTFRLFALKIIDDDSDDLLFSYEDEIKNQI